MQYTPTVRPEDGESFTRPATFAGQVTIEAREYARDHNLTGPKIEALIAALDESFFQTAKAQMKGNDDLAAEFAALSYDGLTKLKASK